MASCISAGVRYGLGAKAPSLSAAPGHAPGGFMATDCSGFARLAVYQASGVTMPDGSVVQHDWVKATGFKLSDVASGKLADGAVRIAFLTPADGGGVGHVVLIYNGRTIESSGSRGPCRRAWTGEGWQAKALVYVLMPSP